MTNTELNQLSIPELRELNKNVMEILRLRILLDSKLNKNTLHVGMPVKYTGSTNRIKNETFVIEKINKVNALCKSNATGMKWNINLANIEPI